MSFSPIVPCYNKCKLPFYPSIASCAFDDKIPDHLCKQLGSLFSTKPKHCNLHFDGPNYDLIQEEEGGSINEADDADEMLDPDGAGADMPAIKLTGGEEDNSGDDNRENEEEEDKHPAKRMRMSADATIALVGFENNLFSMERISRSASASHYSSSHASSVSSLRSAMSVS